MSGPAEAVPALPEPPPHGGAALEVRDVVVAFGGNVALDGASMVAETGLVTGLIGPNGAGKTTLFDVITGLLAPDSGKVALDGVDLTGLAPHRRARFGLARTFQRLELWGALTVSEHVEVATRPHHDGVDPAELLERLGLADVADRRADELPTGRARLVEIARALATRPRVLLLDEPASGLTETETAEVSRLVREVAATGTTVVLVEHDMSLVMGCSDRVVVLDQGRVLAEGTPEEVSDDERVRAAYLGAVAGVAGGGGAT